MGSYNHHCIGEEVGWRPPLLYAYPSGHRNLDLKILRKYEKLHAKDNGWLPLWAKAFFFWEPALFRCQPIWLMVAMGWSLGQAPGVILASFVALQVLVSHLSSLMDHGNTFPLMLEYC